MNLTTTLLEPPVRQTPCGPDINSTRHTNNGTVNGATMSGFGMPAQDSEIRLRKSSNYPWVHLRSGLTLLARVRGDLSEVAIYMHLAVVILASECKAGISPLVGRCLAVGPRAQTR
jgi:hypothetical protein